MQLVILILVAGVVGYFLAKSRLSKPIDDTSEKVTQTTRDLADKTEGWAKGVFSRKQKTESEQVDSEGETVDANEEEAVAEQKKAAQKRTSRRKADTSEEVVENKEEEES